MINSLEYNSSKELDIIDVQALDMENDQTWLYSTNSGNGDIDILKWRTECNWQDYDTIDHLQNLEQNFAALDNTEYGLQRQKCDSRTFTRPKKRMLRPSLETVVQGMNYGNGDGNFTSHLSNGNNPSAYRTMTRQPHGHPLAEERRQTFSTDTITRPRQEDDSQFSRRMHNKHNGTYRMDSGDMSDDTDFQSAPSSVEDGHTSFSGSRPIQINLSEPAHNLHNTFNKLIGTANQRNDSLSNMSPPSLVSSIAMDGSGAFNSGTFSRQGSMCSRKDFPVNDEEEANGDDITAQNSLQSTMTTSILDEKEMNTSMLSQCSVQDESLIGSLPPSLSSSMDASLINSTTFLSGSKRDNSMESSLIDSGTFTSLLEPAEERLPNGKPKFQLRRSFLQPDPDDNFDRFLMLNANCNTEDLRGLSGDLLRSMEKRKCDTYRKDSEKENMNSTFNKDDSFLMTDGMSDSFLKETGRDSLNITYSKMPQNTQRTRTVNRPQMEMEQTVVLPNQVLSPRHNNKPVENNNTFTKKLNGTYDAIPKERESPKRNGTFRKITPPSIRNLTAVISTEPEMDDVKDNIKDDVETEGIVDSNKECYVSTEKLLDISAAQDSREVSPTERIMWTPQRRKDSITMAGGSSDSLEQNSSGSCSPHRAEAPLNMDDLENLAYEQEQKLYQVISTPISNILPQDMGSAAILFKQTALSPILNHHQTTRETNPRNMITPEASKHAANSSSLSSLHRVGAGSPRRLQPKRESSAPEIKANPPSSMRMPFAQKLGLNSSRNSDTGLYVSRSAGGSPAKTSNLRTSPLGSRVLGRLESDHQLTSSNNELRRKTGLPASKLRQYSSHKELNRIPPAPRWSAAGGMAGLGALQPSSRLSLHASNPVLCPVPLVRQASYTLVSKDSASSNTLTRRDFARPVLLQPHVDASHGRLTANLAAQANAGGGLSYGQPMRAKHNIGNLVAPGATRASLAGGVNSQSYIKIPAPAMLPPQSNMRPPTNAPVPTAQRQLPRPSGLPRPSSGIPKRPSIRPPSTYSLAPGRGDQTSDCY